MRTAVMVLLSLIFALAGLLSLLWSWLMPILFPKMVLEDYVTGRISLLVSFVIVLLYVMFWIIGKAVTSVIKEKE